MFYALKDNDYFIPVDEWQPTEEEMIFKPSKISIIAPMTKILLGEEENNRIFDTFILSPKKCYFKDSIISHFTKYINYIEAFYDKDKYLLTVFARIKFMIDSPDIEYTVENLESDIRTYILGNGFSSIVRQVNEDNYIDKIKRNNKKSSVLQYSDSHIKIMMEVSLFQTILIPILIHYAYTYHISTDIDKFLMHFYEILIIEMHPEVDIFNKIGETVNSTISKSYNKNTVLWDKQYIRSMNRLFRNIETVKDLVVQIFPKFEYEGHPLNLIYSSIKTMIGYKVINAKYEFAFKQLSPYKGEGADDEDNSEFDKFVSHLSKRNESLLLHNQVNYERTMEFIDREFGPFTDEEINYYTIELSKNKKTPISRLQRDLVMNLFYRYFGDTDSIKLMNYRSYVKLIIAAKRLLASKGLHTMEAIISSRIVKPINKSHMNQKELTKVKASETYMAIESKYKNEKSMNQLEALLASIMASKYQIIDYENKENTGLPFTPQHELLNEEFLVYVSLI